MLADNYSVKENLISGYNLQNIGENNFIFGLHGFSLK